MVVEHLKTKENETTIILVSDGEETCHPDPCGLVKKLKATGIKFILHVVGFDVNQEQQKQLPAWRMQAAASIMALLMRLIF